MRAGAYGPALKVADQILARVPEDPKALERRAEAVTKLRKETESLAPGKKPRPE